MEVMWFYHLFHCILNVCHFWIGFSGGLPPVAANVTSLNWGRVSDTHADPLCLTETRVTQVEQTLTVCCIALVTQTGQVRRAGEA
eukprot:3830686-Amphidinium_carterae.1